MQEGRYHGIGNGVEVDGEVDIDVDIAHETLPGFDIFPALRSPFGPPDPKALPCPRCVGWRRRLAALVLCASGCGRSSARGASVQAMASLPPPRASIHRRLSPDR